MGEGGRNQTDRQNRQIVIETETERDKETETDIQTEEAERNREEMGDGGRNE